MLKGPLASLERHDRPAFEGRSGSERSTEPGSSAKTVASQPVVGYRIRSRTAKKEIVGYRCSRSVSSPGRNPTVDPAIRAASPKSAQTGGVISAPVPLPGYRPDSCRVAARRVRIPADVFFGRDRQIATRERKLVVQVDSCGDPRPGDETRAAERWNRAASRLHANLDFRLNSQSLAMCLAPEKCLGGRAWPNVIPQDSVHEIPLLLWANSTLGLLLFWWMDSRQQAGRPILTISALPNLPVLDPRKLTDRRLDHCRAIFDDLKDREFLPANEAWRDETRKALDRELLFGITSVLQLDLGLEKGLAVRGRSTIRHFGDCHPFSRPRRINSLHRHPSAKKG